MRCKSKMRYSKWGLQKKENSTHILLCKQQ